ncbi:MAG: hypothetical protein ACYTG5_11090 [Planctomycetota bacterium]|jgi:hypothetical protein
MLTITLLSSLALVPQGPEHIKFPTDSVGMRFAPYIDGSGDPLAAPARSFGSADFDGDGNQELWFLADAGPLAGRLSVQMPRTSDLGRFRAYGELAGGDLSDAATFRSTTSPRDFVLAVDPVAGQLDYFFYLLPSMGDPRNGSWHLQATGIDVGSAPYEIETGDVDGDGHDDIAVLSTGPGGTNLSILHMGEQAGALVELSRNTIFLPAFVQDLRLLDLNGDERSDAVVYAPGFGVFAYVDDGAGNLANANSLPFAGAPLRDLAVGDLDGDGRDDYALVFEVGVAVIRNPAAGMLIELAFKPLGLGLLATAAIFDAGAGPGMELVVFPSDGQSLAIHPYNEFGGGFEAPIIEVPSSEELSNYSGAGNGKLRVAPTDLDNDGDPELVLPLPDGEHWQSMRGPVADLSPLSQVDVVDIGPMGQSNFCEQELTVYLPDSWFDAGIPTLEIAVFLEDPDTGESFYWTRSFPTVDAVSKTAEFNLFVMTNKQGLRNMISNGTRDIGGNMTAGGPTLLSIHGKDGTRRYQSRLIFFDGNGGGQGSEVGIEWDLVAAPPQPDKDEDLLPWN